MWIGPNSLRQLGIARNDVVTFAFAVREKTKLDQLEIQKRNSGQGVCVSVGQTILRNFLFSFVLFFGRNATCLCFSALPSREIRLCLFRVSLQVSFLYLKTKQGTGEISEFPYPCEPSAA